MLALPWQGSLLRNRRHRARQLPPPVPDRCHRRAALRAHRSALPSPNPADRYPNAGELAADLRELAAEAGLLPEQPALRRFLDDPAKFEAELRPKVADAAVAQARKRARRGELARALAEIGRATAYLPNHAGANALLKKLSVGRTALRVAGLAVAGLVLASATWLAWHPPWRKPAPAAAIQPLTQPKPAPIPPPAPAAGLSDLRLRPSAEAKA